MIGPSVLLSLFALGVLGGAAFMWLRARRAYRWPTVAGKVVEAEAYEWKTKGTTYHLFLAYQYPVGHTVHTSQRRGFGATPYGSLEQAKAAYTVGQQVTVHYNPDNPAEAVVELGCPAAWRLVLLAAILIAAAVFFLLKGRSS